VAVLAALALVAVLRALWRRRATAAASAVPAYEESRGSLLALRRDLAGRPLAEVATAASLAVRHYLAEVLDEPALFETREETLARADSFQRLPAGARERLAPLLDRLAECKYGPSRSDPAAAAALVDDCLEVLRGIESTRSRPLS
jgi:hypothetical protein